MPVLNWVGKEAVVNHDKEVPFRLLKKIESFGAESENMVIHGDNLEALKALLPKYYGKIKCIYIDPPYNTGNEGWVYNDNVNSPKIKAWLKKTVGAEGEDLCRHDKWLCMMYPRLKLLRELLRDDGVIFISIDDDEVHHLKLIMNEIFGSENFVSCITWQKKFSPQNDAKYFSDVHDYILVYAKSKLNWSINLLPRSESSDARYSNPDNDPRGNWTSGDLSVKTYSKTYDYEIKTPSGKVIRPPPSRCWRTSKDRMAELIKDNRVWFGKSGDNVPRLKRFLSEVNQGSVPVTLWLHQEVGHNQEARQEIKDIFNDKVDFFSTPKPVALLKRILLIASNKNDIILDSFAGSGSTGHAVMQLNKEDGGNRKFILVEMEDYAKTITAERLKRAIQKEGYKDGFSFYQLDETLLDKQGFINPNCSYEQLAQYLFYAETQKQSNKIEYPIIGTTDETDYYLLFDKRSVLDKAFFKAIKATPKKKVVYADRCLIDEENLKENNITFKQIPYEVSIL